MLDILIFYLLEVLSRIVTWIYWRWSKKGKELA